MIPRSALEGSCYDADAGLAGNPVGDFFAQLDPTNPHSIVGSAVRSVAGDIPGGGAVVNVLDSISNSQKAAKAQQAANQNLLPDKSDSDVQQFDLALRTGWSGPPGGGTWPWGWTARTIKDNEAAITHEMQRRGLAQLPIPSTTTAIQKPITPTTPSVTLTRYGSTSQALTAAPPKTAPAGMSTGAKVALGVGGAAVLGGAAYLLTRRKKNPRRRRKSRK